jgi:L-ribulose-5-phosphate 4-epimerase
MSGSATLKSLREEVCWANKMLPKAGLVTMHSGNVSGFDPVSGRVVIKPSGMDYELITPENLVEVDLESGEVMAHQLKPSVDLSHHLFLYRHDSSLSSVVHTHSNYATAFAAVHRSIPCALTAISDEFGGEIPCTPYIDNEGDHIGEGILKYRGRGPAILLGNHGVFTWGNSVAGALKAAVMVEDVAKTMYLAFQLGAPVPIAQSEVEKWWDRYHQRYGQ